MNWSEFTEFRENRGYYTIWPWTGWSAGLLPGGLAFGITRACDGDLFLAYVMTTVAWVLFVWFLNLERWTP